MPETSWRGNGPHYELSWSGSNWLLRLDADTPGLEFVGHTRSRLLALAGLAVRGHSGSWKSERPILTKFETLSDRVEASYALPAWGGLSLRASWSVLTEIHALDLEIQILADSVDYLKALEVLIQTDLDEQSSAFARAYPVEPRDREAAGLSYDGREPDHILERLTTLPVPDQIGAGFEPKVIETPWIGKDYRYVECVHPEDVARRIVAGNPSNGQLTRDGSALRYGIFGHDLEKGVLIRSRMRGLWRKGPISRDELERLFVEFRESPLPLGP